MCVEGTKVTTKGVYRLPHAVAARVSKRLLIAQPIISGTAQVQFTEGLQFCFFINPWRACAARVIVVFVQRQINVKIYVGFL